VYAAVPGFQLLQKIGMENVAGHIKRLTQSLLSSAFDLGIRVKTSADSAGPLVVLQSKDSNLLVQKLSESDIVASNRHDGLRIAFHVYNTMDDVKAVVEVLKKNIMDPIPPALRDRMEVLELPGYTQPEKRRIARDHLVARQIANHGLTDAQVTFTLDSSGAVTGLVLHQYGRHRPARKIR
jgi:hypothetical protein